MYSTVLTEDHKSTMFVIVSNTKKNKNSIQNFLFRCWLDLGWVWAAIYRKSKISPSQCMSCRFRLHLSHFTIFYFPWPFCSSLWTFAQLIVGIKSSLILTCNGKDVIAKIPYSNGFICLCAYLGWKSTLLNKNILFVQT